MGLGLRENPKIEIEITDNSLVSVLDVVLWSRLMRVVLSPFEALDLNS